ncbi:MAG: carbohydrate ABC transporter permease [Spirochaetia bacterium]|jgi:multiple sugar transport system permease protein|nr:carbohydrate ABC transporter permease [Spirochaetia bacterium]
MVKSKHHRLKAFGFFILVIFIVLFSIFPFVQMLSTSLKYSWDWGNPSLIPTKVNTESYQEILGIGNDSSTVEIPDSVQKLLDSTPNLTEAQKKSILAKYTDTSDVFPFPQYFATSLKFSLTASICALIIAIFGAYSIARMKYRGRALIQRGVLFVYMVGGILLLIPMYKIATALGLTATEGGTMFALIIIYIVQTLPVCLYMLGNSFRSIPFSIEEAAFIEGYSRFQTIVKIIIPLSFGAIATVWVYSFMIAWNEYLFASVFLKSFKDMYTLPIALKALFVSKNAIWDRVSAASLLTAIPVVILFMFVQKFLSGNVAEGGVKG